MTQVKINRVDFTNDVKNGLTRTELKAKYGTPISVINDWAKMLNLEITIKKAKKYVLVDDTDVIVNSTPETINNISEEPQQETVSSGF